MLSVFLGSLVLLFSVENKRAGLSTAKLPKIGMIIVYIHK